MPACPPEALVESDDHEFEMSVPSHRECIKELLAAGVCLDRVIELFRGQLDERGVNRIAKHLISAELPTQHRSEVSMQVLQRSRSARQDDAFIDEFVQSESTDAPEELLDPLFGTLMRDPVVISTGYVLDKSTIFTEAGELRFRICPFTREQLLAFAFPLIEKKQKLSEYKESRIDGLIATAAALISDGNNDKADQVIDIAEGFLDDIGEFTYIHRARRLAEMQLNTSETKALPRLVRLLTRLHRASDSNDPASVADFESQVDKHLVSPARHFLDVEKVDLAAQLLGACADVVAETGKEVAYRPLRLRVARLRLKVAVEHGGDLTMARDSVWAELSDDDEAVALFLHEQGIVLSDLPSAPGFCVEGVSCSIVCRALRFLPIQQGQIVNPAGPETFSVSRGKLRGMNGGVLWTERVFDLSEGAVRASIALDFDRPGRKDIIVGFSQNGTPWDDADNAENTCDAVTLLLNFDNGNIWVRTGMFEVQFAYGQLRDRARVAWEDGRVTGSIRCPPAGETGKVDIVLTRSDVTVDACGSHVRIGLSTDLSGHQHADVVPERIRFGFVSWDDSSAWNCSDVRVCQ